MAVPPVRRAAAQVREGRGRVELDRRETVAQPGVRRQQAAALPVEADLTIAPDRAGPRGVARTRDPAEAVPSTVRPSR